MDAGTFWTAVGSVAACVAAVAAVVALVANKKAAKFVHLKGRWKGDLGDEWDFVADLQAKDGKAAGRIHWTLVECPTSLPWAEMVGASGFELVEGTLEHGVLTLGGTRVVAANPELIGLADYTIPLPTTGQAFQGNSRPKKRGKWQEAGTLYGEVSFPRKPPQHAT